MNDVSRFMRYVIPGLVCTFELLLALAISNNKWFFYHLNVVTDKGFANIFGVVIGVFFASGAVGYIFANVYYSIRSRIGLRNDHRVILKIFIDNFDYRIFIIGSGKNKKPITTDDVEDLRLREAWEIYNLIWYEVKPKSKTLKDAELQINRLLDILHGLGSTLIGSCICLIVWLLFQDLWLFSHSPSMPIFEKIRLDFFASTSSFHVFKSLYLCELIFVLFVGLYLYYYYLKITPMFAIQ